MEQAEEGGKIKKKKKKVIFSLHSTIALVVVESNGLGTTKLLGKQNLSVLENHIFTIIITNYLIRHEEQSRLSFRLHLLTAQMQIC